MKEWQLYAQAVEGETWRDGKLEEGKLEKMSGLWTLFGSLGFLVLMVDRSTNWTAVRVDEGYWT